MKILFPIAFLGFMALLAIYIDKRLIKKLYLKSRYIKTFRIFLFLNFIGIAGYMISRYYPEIPSFLYLMLSISIGVIFLLFCITIFYDLFSLSIKFIPLSENRRLFFKKSLDFTALGFAGFLTGRSIWEAKHIVVENIDIKIKNLAQNFRIVQLSDIHIGGLIDEKFIKDMVMKVNVLNPDLIVITGDLIDIKVKFAKKAISALKELKSKYGTYFITGNHEFFHDIDEILAELRLNNIKILNNESSYVGEYGSGFNLVGVNDIFGYRMGKYMPDINMAISKCIKGSPSILLAHQPLFVEEAQNFDIDLMLSGHTHGGQLYPFRFWLNCSNRMWQDIIGIMIDYRCMSIAVPDIGGRQ
jgi:predicted MPP superfamily phosphohydrolase